MSDAHPADELYNKWEAEYEAQPGHGIVNSSYEQEVSATVVFRAGYDAAKAWRPISEAPKDGQRFWLVEGEEFYVGWYESLGWDYYDKHCHPGWRSDEGYPIYPTHFQPLPEAPNDQD